MPLLFDDGVLTGWSIEFDWSSPRSSHDARCRSTVSLFRSEREKTEMKRHGISIKEIETAAELEQAQRIRKIVLEDEQGFPHEINVDGLDPSAMHVLVLDQDEPVGTARVVRLSKEDGMLARIALLPSHRGQGLGEPMLRHLEAVAKQAGLKTIHAEPHAHLEPFFLRLGYLRVSGSVEIGGQPLIRLRKSVT